MSFPKSAKKKSQPSEHDGGLHVLPSPEEIDLNTWYTLNLNPNDALQSFGKNAKHRIDNLHGKMRTELATHIAPYCDYELQMEFSSKGRLHYHGKIRFKEYSLDDEDIYRNVRLFYLNGMFHIMAYSSICIEPIKDDKWIDYVTKGAHLFKDIAVITSKSISDKQRLEYAKVANFEDAYGNLKNA